MSLFIALKEQNIKGIFNSKSLIEKRIIVISCHIILKILS